MPGGSHFLFAEALLGEFPVRCTIVGCGHDRFEPGPMGLAWKCGACGRTLPPGIRIARSEPADGCCGGGCRVPPG